ncbi:MarR family winged helix-turn-helix transcriptional regulator [Tianweitania populi]|uniref:MarR family transcriptional regulator n=1 Tax=Tianweitania populi TaxID=1607949 RepID=A0A8J3GJJ5_9HYPH|nr:MarR family transcriptional regulator [Tianweitania populi]GHD12455.1 MarR family transcriptional regulator [Tianweitania populi]
MTQPTDKQLATLGAAFNTFTRRYKLADALGPEKPLNELDKQALFYVAEHPECGPSDIARFLAVPHTTISSATDRLAKRGLLKRTRPEEDRRAVALDLSDEGRRRVEGFLAAYRELHLRMLQPLSTAERDAFVGMITKIVYDEG